jgi:hypothetical protein
MDAHHADLSVALPRLGSSLTLRRSSCEKPLFLVLLTCRPEELRAALPVLSKRDDSNGIEPLANQDRTSVESKDLNRITGDRGGVRS